MSSYRVLMRVFCGLFLLELVRSQIVCNLPSEDELNTEFKNALISQSGDPGSDDPVISYFEYVCLAAGEQRDTYRSLSVVVEYTRSNRQRVAQMQMICNNLGGLRFWSVESGSLVILSDPDYRSIQIRNDCSSCTLTATNVQNCEECHSSCTRSLCTGPGESDCCNVYTTSGYCSETCPSINEIASRANNYTCTSCDRLFEITGPLNGELLTDVDEEDGRFPDSALCTWDFYSQTNDPLGIMFNFTAVHSANSNITTTTTAVPDLVLVETSFVTDPPFRMTVADGEILSFGTPTAKLTFNSTLFRGAYSVSYTTFNTSCSETITISDPLFRRNIKSLGYPNNYPIYLYCAWDFTISTPGFGLRIHFNDYDVACQQDYLRFSHSNAIQACGTRLRNTTLNILESGLFIYFFSDYSDTATGRGFDFDISLYRIAPECVPSCVNGRCVEGGYCECDTGYTGVTCDTIVPVDVCLLPVDSGPCPARGQRYYYNQLTQRCELFHWGGCGGNENRFLFAHLCEERCSDCPPLCSVEFCVFEPRAVCSISTNSTQTTCDNGCELSNCQACFYHNGPLPLPAPTCPTTSCTDNSPGCIEEWAECMKREYYSAARDFPRQLNADNFHCWSYPCY